MNTKRMLFIMFVTLCVAQALTACGSPATPAALPSEPTVAPPVPTTTADAITIVQNYYNAVNAGEFEEMASLMAEDIVGTWPGGKYFGKQELMAANQDSFAAGMRFEISDLKDTDGRVTSCFKVFAKDALIDQGCTGVTLVRRGQIIFDGLTQHEPEYIVERYYQALNAKDLELAMSFVASDATFINPTGTYEGAQAIRESLEGLNTDGITFDLSNFHGFAGRVVYNYKVMQGGNLLDQGANGLTIVRDGKIIFDGTEDTEVPATGQVDPAAIAQEFYKAANAGDIDAAMALVAEDVKCRVGCYITGKESFRSFIQGSINIGGGGGRVELSDLKVEGDKVTYFWKAYNKNGNFVASGNEALHIEDGKITLMEILPD